MRMQLVRAFVFISLGAALTRLGLGWWGPLAGLAVGMLLPMLHALRRDWSGLKLSIDRETLSVICQYGLPLSLTVALTIVISSSDRFLIAWILGKDAAGLYSVAVDFTSQTITLLMMVICLAVYPLAVRAWEEYGREAAQREMRHNASLLLAVGLPAAVGLSVLAPGVANCFLGESFRHAFPQVVPLVATGTFLAGLKAFHFDTAFQFVNRTIIQVWIVLVAAVVNIALNLVAIRRFGINGAASASVLAYLLAIVLTAMVGRRYFVLPFPLKPLLQTLAAAGTMALVLYPFRADAGRAALVAQIAAGASVYGTVLFALDFQRVRTTWLKKRAKSTVSATEPSPAIVQIAEPLQAGTVG